MAFVPEEQGALKAVGYVGAYSADQVMRSLSSEYDYLEIEALPSEVELFHHSMDVYKVEVKITKVQ